MRKKPKRPKKQIPASPLSVERVPRADPAATEPAGRKQPRKQPPPPERDDKLVIVLGKLDLDSEWCLSKITQQDLRVLLQRIRDIEQMTMHEVFSQDGMIGKDYPLDGDGLPNKDAQRRLRDLLYDDLDHISRLRIGGKKRLYGRRIGSRFYALWWDPEHEIWPSSG